MKAYLVYYLKDNPFDIDDDEPYVNISKDYVPVQVVVAKNESAVYNYMQGEIWSPNGEARELIETLGLKHTSMSIGDIVYDIEEGEYYKVIAYAFLRVLDCK